MIKQSSSEQPGTRGMSEMIWCVEREGLVSSQIIEYDRVVILSQIEG